MLHQFRHLYPQGSIISELINIDRGLYIVKVALQDRELILGTGLAAADTVEKAEDRARERALMTIDLEKAIDLEKGDLATRALRDRNSQLKHSQSVAPQIKQSSPTVPQTQTYAIESPKKQDNYHPPSIKETPEATVTSNPIPTSEAISEQELDNFAPPTIPQEVTPDILPQTTPIEGTQTNIFEQPITPPPVEETTPVELETETIEQIVELDFNLIKHKTDLEMKRLNWTKEQGRDYLLSTYGKRARIHLTDEELLEFWRYLETLPN